jgi:hypothetical protein
MMDNAELKHFANALMYIMDKYLDEVVRNKSQKDAADELTRLAQDMSVESNEKIRRVLATLDLLEWEANGTAAWPIVDSVTKRIRKVLEND